MNNTDEHILEILQQTLTKIDELNTRLGHIEKDLVLIDKYQANTSHYARSIESAIDNNNIMG